MPIEILGPVDWAEWRKVSPTLPVTQPTHVVPAAVTNGVPHAISEVERVALLVLSIGRQRDIKMTRAVQKSIRTALRDIESSVLSCEQEIDYGQDDE